MKWVKDIFDKYATECCFLSLFHNKVCLLIVHLALAYSMLSRDIKLQGFLIDVDFKEQLSE